MVFDFLGDKKKVVIAMAHIGALPGSPLYDADGGVNKLIEGVLKDIEALQTGGVDAVMFGNENDRPYVLKAPPEGVAGMTAVVQAVKPHLKVPFGVNYLWDPLASVAIAAATGASFVREIFTGLFASDMGLWQADCAGALRLRRNLGREDMKLLFNINAEFAHSLDERPIALAGEERRLLVACGRDPGLGPLDRRSGRPLEPQDRPRSCSGRSRPRQHRRHHRQCARHPRHLGRRGDRHAFQGRRKHLEPSRRRARQALHGRRGEAEVTALKQQHVIPANAGIQHSSRDQARVWIPAFAGMTQPSEPRLPMPCVLGLDIGTTSTIGILIRPPDETLALASRPVTLRSDHIGWAEEDPEQWWSNVGEIVRELLHATGVSAADIAAVGVTGMLPAVVLLDSAGRLLRPSIQQSDARCGAEVEELRAEIDEKAFLAKAGNGINQQLVAAKLRWIERHEPEIFARIATVFGSYDYINWRLTGERAIEQNWALEAGFVDLATHAIDDALVALAHIPRRRAAAQGRLARNLGRRLRSGRGGERA